MNVTNIIKWKYDLCKIRDNKYNNNYEWQRTLFKSMNMALKEKRILKGMNLFLIKAKLSSCWYIKDSVVFEKKEYKREHKAIEQA